MTHWASSRHSFASQKGNLAILRLLQISIAVSDSKLHLLKPLAWDETDGWLA